MINSSLLHSIKRLDAELKSKRKKLTDFNKRMKAAKNLSLMQKMQAERQEFMMKQSIFNTKQQWYRLKIQIQEARKK